MAAPDVGTSQNSQLSHISIFEPNDHAMGESQESCTQHEMTQVSTQHELTQLGLDDDNDSICQQNSPFSPIDPLTVPWGRLIPQNNSGAVDMTPRHASTHLPASGRKSPRRSPSPATFMGLRNLSPGDRFNEYILGRSAKADVTANKLFDTAKQPVYDYAHSSISNRHCRIYCILSSEMEVFVEDTSGNGTWINNTTLLRKNERRKLHTGDVICLVNPAFIGKKIRNQVDKKVCISQYSYVFVNLWEQEARGVSPKPRGVVNAKAVKMHSAQTGRRRDCYESNSGTGLNKNSLGAFLNQPKSCSEYGHRRIEEDYDIRELLGTGTCGEVRRAIHRHSGDERAVKIIRIGDRRGAMTAGHFSDAKLKLIQAEAEILRSLDHPYVVKLFDVYVSPNKAIYLVMELLRGGDLFDRIVLREKYSEVQARRIMRRILAAVYHLHEERGIVHRDLKPENLMMINQKSDIDIKLTDFGVAKNLTAEGLKTFCGTPQYFAPEVFKRCNTVKGEGRYGKEIDCWSLGVILFILLSGSPPFEVTASFDAVANAEIKFNDEQWKEISNEAKDLVKELLQKDPCKRMSVKDACNHSWVLKEDGDTHCHPMSDPLITKMSAAKHDDAAPREVDEEDTANLDEQIPSKADSQSASLTSTLETFSTNHDVPTKDEPMQSETLQNNSKTIEQSLELSSNECADCNPAPALHHKSNAPKPELDVGKQKENYANRLNSILPHDDGKSVTNAISQAIEVSLKSPNPGSPIHRKKLFDRDVAGPETVRKLSKANVESIKTAGETLPKPVLQTAVKTKPKKEKGINSYFAPALKGKKPKSKASEESDSKPPDSEKKRKNESSSVTSPIGEQLVFSLNKRMKVDAKKRKSDASALSREGEPHVSKAELSEDELQSDFSDAEDTAESVIDNSLAKASLTEQLAKNKVTNIMFKPSKTEVETKKIQSYLFGKAPLDTTITQNDDQEDSIDNMDESKEQTAVTSDSKAETVEFKCNNALPMPKSTDTKGNQKSIKSWFLPKTKK